MIDAMNTTLLTDRVHTRQARQAHLGEKQHLRRQRVRWKMTGDESSTFTVRGWQAHIKPV